VDFLLAIVTTSLSAPNEAYPSVCEPVSSDSIRTCNHVEVHAYAMGAPPGVAAR